MGEKIKVYRIQDETGRGPWKPGFSHLWVEGREDLDNLIPWVMDLGNVIEKARWAMHLGCACESPEKLKRWFTKLEYERLLKYGYNAVEMEVDLILGQSEIQLVFERSIPLKQDFKIINLYE
jgi:hypothetical protein